MARVHGIDWDRAPLGKLSDAHIASLYGCSTANVFRARKRRGIPAFKNPLKNQGTTDHNKHLLGKFSDSAVADLIGVCRAAVTNARKKYGVPRWKPPWRTEGRLPGEHTSIDWDLQPLGKVPDRVLAESLGVGETAVFSARQIRGIAAHMGVGNWYTWVWDKWPRDTWEVPNNISRKGQRCKLLAVGRKGSVLVEFEDGYRVVTLRRGLRKTGK